MNNLSFFTLKFQFLMWRADDAIRLVVKRNALAAYRFFNMKSFFSAFFLSLSSLIFPFFSDIFSSFFLVFSFFFSFLASEIFLISFLHSFLFIFHFKFFAVAFSTYFWSFNLMSVISTSTCSCEFSMNCKTTIGLTSRGIQHRQPLLKKCNFFFTTYCAKFPI